MYNKYYGLVNDVEILQRVCNRLVNNICSGTEDEFIHQDLCKLEVLSTDLLDLIARHLASKPEESGAAQGTANNDAQLEMGSFKGNITREPTDEFPF